MLLRVFSRALKITILVIGMLLVWLMTRLGLRRLWWAIGRRSRTYVPLGNEVIVRQAFEAMGPTFIKLGQVVASSPGLFPKRYAEEFAKCLDRVPPFDLVELKSIVERELGGPLDSIFDDFEDVPLGSASIAQVHGARLKDGTPVVIKVQRPGISDVVDADVWWMRRGSKILERLFLGARLANLSGVIDDFDRTIHEELDFRKEAENQIEFNAIMADHDITDVKAPKPCDGLVSERVLVMERFVGFKADHVEAIRAAGIDAEQYIRRGLRAWLLTVMLRGYFHGDAHAGNLMLLPEGPAVGFLDFGIIGRFTDKEREQVMRFVLAFIAKDYEALGDLLMEVGAIEEGIDRAALVADLARVYAPLLELSIQDIHYEEVMPEMMRVSYRYGITLPREFLLILKQLLFFDRYAKLAAPHLNVFTDVHLVDFLFTPAARKAGIDFNVMMPLMQRIQANAAKRG